MKYAESGSYAQGDMEGNFIQAEIFYCNFCGRKVAYRKEYTVLECGNSAKKKKNINFLTKKTGQK